MHTLFDLNRLQKLCEQLLLSGLRVFVERTCEVGQKSVGGIVGNLEGKEASELDKAAL